MFADQLSSEQRQVVFDLAVMLAHADHDVSEEEQQYLKNFSGALGIEYDLDKSDMNIDNALMAFTTRRDKIILLQELVKLSYKDGHFGQEEQENVFMIAQKIGLNDPELLIRVETWVREGVNWIYEGEQMLES